MEQVYSRFIAFITFFEFLYSGPQDPGFWGLWDSGFGALEARPGARFGGSRSTV